MTALLKCWLIRNAGTEQAEVILRLESQSFQFNVKIFTKSALSGVPEKTFSLGFQPTPSSPVQKECRNR
jgi:hypothetical protein